LSIKKLEELKETSRHVRADIVNMTAATGSGHPGGSLRMLGEK